jgi:hypothetical protein
VLLKARNLAGNSMAFNFGPADPVSCSGVNITIDVTIVGEHIGRSMTTTDGCYLVFLEQVPAKTHIESIDFEAPLGAAIRLYASTGTEIVGNHINGVIG